MNEMQPTVPGGTNPSLVFAPTDLSILARCTIVYVTTRGRQSGWWAKGTRSRGGSRTEAQVSEEDKPARLNYC